jgi:hypothetical protein
VKSAPSRVTPALGSADACYGDDVPTDDRMKGIDLEHLRSTIALSRRSRESGNQSFGALLADPRGEVLVEAESTVLTGSDCTGHAVTNLMRMASHEYSVPDGLHRVRKYRAVSDVLRRHLLGRRRSPGLRAE